MTNFIKMLRGRGWHAGVYCCGSCWVADHGWNGYDGRDYLREIGVYEGVCQDRFGRYYEGVGAIFRNSYFGCLGTEKMRGVARSFVDRLLDWGVESLQYFDQNLGSVTFACFAKDHDHPPKPGKWMHDKMETIIGEMDEMAACKGESGAIHSAEAGLNETCLHLFAETELRTHADGFGSGTIPLYQYLFHECVIIQGMMGNAPEPYHLEIRNAANCVLGSLPGGVLTGDGTLLAKDTHNWSNWEPKIGDSENPFKMIRSATALRRGPADRFLVYGRMLRPPKVKTQRVEWSWGEKNNSLDAVFSAAWQSPEGRLGVVLANWTADEREVTVFENRLETSSELTVYMAGEKVESYKTAYDGTSLSLKIPPFGCALVTADYE